MLPLETGPVVSFTYLPPLRKGVVIRCVVLGTGVGVSAPQDPRVRNSMEAIVDPSNIIAAIGTRTVGFGEQRRRHARVRRQSVDIFSVQIRTKRREARPLSICTLSVNPQHASPPAMQNRLFMSMPSKPTASRVEVSSTDSRHESGVPQCHYCFSASFLSPPSASARNFLSRR